MRVTMGSPDANDFFPSSCAAGALGLIIPTLSSKPVAPATGVTVPSGFALVSVYDESLRRAGMIALFVGLLGWIATVFLSIGGKLPQSWTFLASIDTKFWIGFILYVVGIALNELKEGV